MFAVNAASFDLEEFFVDLQETKVSKLILPS